MSTHHRTRKHRANFSSLTTHQRGIVALSAATGLVAWAAVSRADTYGNAYSTDGHLTTLNSSGAWTDETSPSTDSPPPGANDIAQFDSLAGLTSTTTFTLGTPTSWDGLTITDPGASIVIGTSGDSSNTLTLGADGLNMSSANQNLTIVDPLNLLQNLNFAVNGGQTLTVDGGISLNTSTLTFTGAGTQNIAGILNDGGAGGAITQGGLGTVILSAANSYTGATTVDSGVLELNFAAAGAPSSNIAPSGSQLRLGGGTLLVNGGSSGGTQNFASTDLTASAGLTIVQTTNNAVLNMGTISVDTGSTNAGGLIEFVGPATSSDGLGATLVAATGTITAAGSSTTSGSGNILIDGTGAVPYAVVGESGNPNMVTDFAAVNASGDIVGGSTISGFYQELASATGEPTSGLTNVDISSPGEYRWSSNSNAFTSLRFNTPNGGLYNDGVNDIDQILVKSGNVLEPGAILVTPNVGANNVLIQAQGGPGAALLGGEGNNIDVTVFQYNTQGAFIIDGGIRAAGGHNGGYAQAGPGTVELNGVAASTYTLASNLYGGLTVIGNYAKGSALGTGAIFLNGGNVTADYSGNFDNGSARAVTLGDEGGSVSATAGNTLTVDGAITGSGPLNIGYGALETNEENSTSMVVSQNVATTGSGDVILSGGSSNTYTGGTNINYGTLQLDTVSAGTGSITVNGHGTLAGTATLTNATVVNSGGTVSPGDLTSSGPVLGTLGLGPLTLNAGSILEYGFSGTSSSGLIKLDGSLDITGASGMDAYFAGTKTAFTNSGLFDVMDVAAGDTISGLSNLSVLDNPDPGVLHYTFGTASDGSGGTYVTLDISGGGGIYTWTGAASDNEWTTNNNWNPNSSFPNSTLATAEFLNAYTGGGTDTISINGSQSIGEIEFNDTAGSYLLAAGVSGNLTLGGSATIEDAAGNHGLSVPLTLTANAVMDVTSASNTLSISGAISGSSNLTINSLGGVGKVLLTSGGNNYSGTTTIVAGTLQAGNGSSGSLGSGAVTIDTPATLAFDIAGTVDLANNLLGGGALSQIGAGTLELAGTNSVGAVNIGTGSTIQVTGASGLTASGDLTMTGTALLDLDGNNATVGTIAGSGTIDDVSAGGTPTLTFGGNDSQTFAGIIQNTSGTLALVKNASGTETLSGANTFTGGITINGGAVKAMNNAAVGAVTGTITINTTQGLQLANGVTISNPIALGTGLGSNEFEDVPDDGASATIASNITITGGSGTQFRVGTSAGGASPDSTITLTGTTTAGSSEILITRGNVIFDGNASVTSTNSEAMIFGRYNPNDTLNMIVEGNASLSGIGIDIGGNGSTSSDNLDSYVTLEGNAQVSAGNGALSIDSSAIANNNTSLTLGGTSTLSAGSITESNTSLLTASSATVILNGGTILATAGDIAMNGGGNGAVDTDVFLPNLSVVNSGGVTGVPTSFAVASGGGTINNGGFTITVAQSFGDQGGGLTYAGSGTTVIANNNSFSGNATLAAGTLVVANGSGGSATGTGKLILNGGILASANATLIAALAENFGGGYATTGAGFITGTVQAGSGPSTIAPGGVGTIGTITMGALVTSSNLTLDFDLGTPVSGGSYTGDLIDLTSGPLTVGAGSPIAFGVDPTTDGDYRLIEGSFGSPTLSNFVLPSQSGYTYSLSTSVDSGYIDLVVATASGPTNLTWDNAGGSGNGTTWDTTQQNWNNGTSVTTYSNGSNVTFNDTNNSHYNVTLDATVTPNSVTVTNSLGNYIISGTGGIAGTGSLVKGGSDSLTLSTVNTYSGGTTVNAGDLIVAAHGALPDGALTIAGGKVQLAANTGATNLTSLSISHSAALDVGNNHVIISDPGGAIDSTIEGYLATGYSGGGWNGTSANSGAIITSAATGTTYGLGWADGEIGGISGLSSGQLEIKYTLYGDTNLDGTVNSVDFGTLAANFGTSGKTWAQGAFTYNGTVNSVDFGLLANNFGKSLGSNGDVATAADWAALDAFAEANGLMSEVPEPATTGLLAVGLVGMLARRRRRNATA